MKEADQLRDYLARDPQCCIIGNIGGAGETLTAVLDRLEELEFIVWLIRDRKNKDGEAA